MAAEPASNPLKELKSAGGLIMGAGAVSIIAGVLAIAYPDITLLALAIFAGVNLIVLGVLSLIDAFGDDAGGRTLSAILGVLGLIAGLVVLRRPGETLVALLLVLGIWMVVSGAIGFIRAFDDLETRALRMLVAICEIVLGILVLSLPDLSLKTLAILIGISFVLRGAAAVYAGWQLRKAGTAAGGTLAPA